MKVCCVCGKEIRTDLEEFGDPREPVCASCWLAGAVPGINPYEKEAEVKEQGFLINLS